MEKRLSSLYRLGGLTGILSGLLMIASSIWFIFALSSMSSPPSAEQFGRIGIFHGIGVVTIILLAPTLLASYGLLSSEAQARSALGSSIAILWLVIELIAHCSQTAPINALSELVGESATATIGAPVYDLWVEWGRSTLYDRCLPVCLVSALLWFSTACLGESNCGVSIFSCDNSLSSRHFLKSWCSIACANPRHSIFISWWCAYTSTKRRRDITKQASACKVEIFCSTESIPGSWGAIVDPFRSFVASIFYLKAPTEIDPMFRLHLVTFPIPPRYLLRPPLPLVVSR